MFGAINSLTYFGGITVRALVSNCFRQWGYCTKKKNEITVKYCRLIKTVTIVHVLMSTKSQLKGSFSGQLLVLHNCAALACHHLHEFWREKMHEFNIVLLLVSMPTLPVYTQ